MDLPAWVLVSVGVWVAFGELQFGVCVGPAGGALLEDSGIEGFTQVLLQK